MGGGGGGGGGGGRDGDSRRLVGSTRLVTPGPCFHHWRRTCRLRPLGAGTDAALRDNSRGQTHAGTDSDTSRDTGTQETQTSRHGDTGARTWRHERTGSKKDAGTRRRTHGPGDSDAYMYAETPTHGHGDTDQQTRTHRHVNKWTVDMAIKSWTPTEGRGDSPVHRHFRPNSQLADAHGVQPTIYNTYL